MKPTTWPLSPLNFGGGAVSTIGAATGAGAGAGAGAAGVVAIAI